tara:strand:+ start:1562 stop:2494 length:933 start_codon:yes stop_codon:yes gene_type:complete
MPDRNGYIGRAPGDSAVQVARQTFTASGITTDFTFSSGYVPGYFDVYINGVKMIEGSDYTSTDSSTFSILNGGAADGDVLEAVAYKAFNAATVTNASTLTVSGDLTVLGTGTFTGAGTSVSFATTAFNLSGTPDIAARNITGTGATFTGDVNIGGVLSYEDVQNIDSVGIVTARTGVRITNGGLIVTAGIATLGAGLTMGDNDKAFFGDGGDLEIFHDGTRNYIDSKGSQLRIETDAIRLRTDSGETYLEGDANSGVKIYFNNSKKFETTGAGVTITGVCTATSFEGSGANLTNLPASGDSNDITASLFL